VRKGFSLPGVMAISLLLFVLFIGLQNSLRGNRHRISREKHQQAAVWLAISGADVAQARLAKGSLKAGQDLKSPSFQQGRFTVTTKKRGSKTLIESTGIAARERYLVTRTVGASR
jgi:hypothetical protein